MKVHYYYDPPYQDGGHNKSISGSLTSSVSTAAIIFRGEMYEVRKGRKWAADAPAFGIPFGARHISIHVQLPDSSPVRHEPYRQFVQLSSNDQRQLMVDDFAEIVFRHRPEWLIDIINSLAPKASASTDDLRKQLQELLNELRVKAQAPQLTPQGIDLVDQGGARGATQRQTNGTGGGGGRATITPTDLVFNPAGVKRASISKNMESAPEIIPLSDEEHIAEKEIAGKAARYFRETNQLFINLKYSAVVATQEHLELRYATYDDPQMVRELARQWAERLLMGRVGYAVVYAQAKQLIREWTSDDVKKALEPESLSLAADGWRDAVSSAYHSIGRRLGISMARVKADDGCEPSA